MSHDTHLSSWLAIATREAKGEAEPAKACGFHRIAVADFAVTAIYDGEAPLPIDELLTGTTPEDARQRLAEGGSRSPMGISVNAFLIERGDRRILIDAGAGANFGSACGRLASNLEAAGHPPETIDAVLLTHIHPDHTGGLVGVGGIAFPNTELFVSRIDRDYWFDPVEKANANDELRKTFEEGTAGVAPYLQADRVTAFDGGEEILPGVRTIAAPGHTAGHTMYRVGSDGHEIVFFGDLVHSAEVQMLDPSIAIKLDSDEARAVETRKAWLPGLTDARTLCAGAHTFFPGFGHVVRNGSSFAWLPLETRPGRQGPGSRGNESLLESETSHDRN